MPSFKKVVVLGAGALGSLIGGRLALQGIDVTLVGRGTHVAEIRERDLTIDYGARQERIRVKAFTELEETPDIAIVTVKLQDLSTALRGWSNLLKGATVVTLMNGLAAEQMARSILSSSTIVGCVATTVATHLTPGVTSCASLGHLVVGAMVGDGDADAAGVAPILDLAIPTVLTRDLAGARWTKHVISASLALPAATGMSYADMVTERHGARMQVRLLRETLGVARAARASFAPLPGISPSWLRLLGALPERIASRVYARSVLRRKAAQPAMLGSMLQSLKRGRPTEVDYINGELARIAVERGRRAPLNAMLVDVVREVERTGRHFTIPELWSRFERSEVA